jgi:hypothetical protein
LRGFSHLQCCVLLPCSFDSDRPRHTCVHIAPEETGKKPRPLAQAVRLCLLEEQFVTLRNAAINRSVDRKARPFDVRGSIHLPIPFRSPGCIIYLIREKEPRAQEARAERKETQMKKMMMERLVDVEVTPYGTIIEEIEVVCTMTGFRRRVLVEHTLEGASRSLEVMA